MNSHITTSHLPKRSWLARAIAALLVASALSVAPHAQARVFISVNFAPPPLPVYVQPAIPGPDYIWTPGYWAWDADANDYYWVPGTWVVAPYVGALWTPGYWGWSDDAYVFYPGYWGLNVGYYGGIDYGFGYTGIGYYGGYWGHGHFYYNSAVNRFGGTRITNVYNRTVVNNATVNRFSFNGPGGVNHTPTRAEMANSRERRTGPVSAQVRQQTLARHDVALRASVNHGAPPILATPRAGAFERANATSTRAAGVRSVSTQHQGMESRAHAATSARERPAVAAHQRRSVATMRTRAAEQGHVTAQSAHASRTQSSRSRPASVVQSRRPSANGPRELRARREQSRRQASVVQHPRATRPMSEVTHTRPQYSRQTSVERHYQSAPVTQKSVRSRSTSFNGPSSEATNVRSEYTRQAPVERHYQEAAPAMQSARSRSTSFNRPSQEPVNRVEPRQIARNETPRAAPVEAGPRSNAGTRMQAPRQTPTPRSGGQARPSGSNKPKDRGPSGGG